MGFITGFIKKLNEAKRRGNAGFLAVLGAVPVVILTILIIVQVVGSLDTTLGGMDFGVDGNATRDDVFTNTWNGLKMVPIVVIILFASVVLGAIGLLGLRS